MLAISANEARSQLQGRCPLNLGKPDDALEQRLPHGRTPPGKRNSLASTGDDDTVTGTEEQAPFPPDALR